MSTSLSQKQVEEIKRLVIEGVSPQDIANHFGVAISTVHYYKGKFKKEGLEFPEMRGKKPTGSINNTFGQTPIVAEVQPNLPGASATNKVDLTINGVSVSIIGAAKNVTVNNGHIEVNY